MTATKRTPTPAADGGGLRYNKGKTRYGLLPPEWLRSLAEIMTKGAEKYAPRNWERGMDPDIMIDCALRHLDAWRRGERYDAETGCHHLGHAAWNILALMTYDVRGFTMPPPVTLKHPTMQPVEPKP